MSFSLSSTAGPLVTPAAVVGVALFGLLLGSFFNVVIHRLPLTDVAGLRRRTPYTLSYLSWPLSFCPHCKATIPPWHNIPVISYLWLRGRGACCNQPIRLRYLVVELSGGALFLLSLFYARDWFDFTCLAIFFSFLFVAAAIDLYRYYLLDVLTLPLLWLGLLVNINTQFAPLSDAVIGAAVGYTVLLGIAYFVGKVLNRQAMGMGDFKLTAAIGAWLGWQDLPLLLFLASCLGVVFAGVRAVIRHRRKKRYIPFGVCLAAAAGIVVLYGDEITTQYFLFVL